MALPERVQKLQRYQRDRWALTYRLVLDGLGDVVLPDGVVATPEQLAEAIADEQTVFEPALANIAEIQAAIVVGLPDGHPLRTNVFYMSDVKGGRAFRLDPKGTVLRLGEYSGDQTPPDGGAVGKAWVATIGKYNYDGEPFEIKQSHFDAALAEFAANPRGEIAVDYAHASENGAASAADQAKASGWAFELFQEGNQLFSWVRWTKAATEGIKAEEYRYLSPVLLFDAVVKAGERAGEKVPMRVKSMALTSIPFIDDQPPLTLAEPVVANKAPGPEDEPMKLSDKTLSALSLSEGHDEAAVDEAVANLITKLGEATAKAETATTDEAKLALRLAELEKKDTLRDAQDLIDGVIKCKEPKLLIKQRDEWVTRAVNIGLEETTKILADMQPIQLLSPPPGSDEFPEGGDVSGADTKQASDIVHARALKLMEKESALKYADACARVLSEDKPLALAYVGAEEN